MKRSRSPFSKNTVLAVLESDDLSDGALSDESAESSVVDDSDEDPWYEPNSMPSTSTGRPSQIRSRPMLFDSSSSSDEDDYNPGTQPNRGRPRGRPAGRPRLNQDMLDEQNIDEEHETEGNRPVWQSVNEENDPGFAHSFMYDKQAGVKHCPPPETLSLLCILGYFSLWV
uniref:Uncharacterized protein n=1 Tax=Homalodisca liturata TaxID=320908 RepID=A0A1B6K5Q8_9HEMI